MVVSMVCRASAPALPMLCGHQVTGLKSSFHPNLTKQPFALQGGSY